MNISIIKKHNFYSLGVHNVTDERGHYLINIGVAEKVEMEAMQEKKEGFKPVEKKQIKKP